MKQGKLIRRAVSAALAGCMMFTLSAPALAESTDALMQLSTGSYRSSSLLSEENSFPTTIKVNGKPVTEANISSILGSENTGKLSYDGVTNTLKSNGRIKGDLTIDAPGVNIELCNSTSGEAAVSGKLTVTNAQDVKVTAQSYVAVLGDVEISCDGKVEITSEESPTVAGDVTVKQASTVAISGESYGYHIVRGDVTIACPATVVIQNHGTGGMASSIVYSGGKYVYSDTVDGTPVDPSGKPIDAKANAVYITPKMYYTINSNDTAVIIKVDDTEAGKARPGQTIKAWAPNKDGWEFENWEATGIDLGKQVNKNWITFKMPESNVTLNPHYAKLHAIEVVNGTADITSAKEGTKVTVTADDRPGYVFDHWESEQIRLTTSEATNPSLTFAMPDEDVVLKAVPKTLYTITVDGETIGTAAVGDTVHIKADLPEDRKFSHWKGNVSLNGHEEDSEFDLVITEEKNVELTSVTTQRYYIIIIDANGETKTEAEAGNTYNIKAAGRDGWDFTGWVVDNADVVSQLDLTKADNQGFVMPAGTDVTITATYKKQRTVTVIGGTVNSTDSVTALREETVEIKAEYDPYEKKFDHWEVKGPKGWDLEDDQKTNPEFTLTVPKGNVTLTAVYNDYHNITVEGGYATPDRAIAGTQITLTPNLPDDQEFDYWYSTDINLREDQRGNPNLTFKMRDFDIKITAVPKQLYFVDLEDADTTANGEDTRVEVKTGKEVVLVAPEREGFRFNHWEVTSGTVGLIDADKTTAYFTMKSENVRIKAIYDEYHTITMVDGKGTAYDADGKEITSAVVGDKITIVAKDRDSHEFNHWEIDPDNVILEDPNADKTAFTMPDEPVSVEAKYKHLQSITMNHGTAYDEDFSETDIAKAKQTITIKAEDRYADGLVFDHWAVDTDNVILADEYDEKTTFEMVNGAVELTAHYKARVTVFSVPAKFEEGIGEHSDETWEKVGETATITAKIDEETFPGMEFDYWEVIPTDLDIGNIHSQTISFEVPECEVKLVAHWKASGMNPIVDPDEDLDPGFGVETESSDGGAGGAGAAIAGVAIGGAAVWGGYEIATRVILHNLLPEGAAIPANRGQLALLIWTEKGKPEPAAQPAFADITDAEQAKAAQWCVEQGLLDAREGKFESDGWMPKFKTIEIWNKAFPKK